MTLDAPMAAEGIALMRFVEADREALRAACARDRDIWSIYPYSMVDEHFDPSLDARLEKQDWIVFTIRRGADVVGVTCYIGVDPKNRSLEIGGTYYVPSQRGSGLNAVVKRLMLERAFGNGFRRVQFSIDTRNGRSMRAVEKIGAVHEGTLRKHRVTWTGHARDTAIYSILADEWPFTAG